MAMAEQHSSSNLIKKLAAAGWKRGRIGARLSPNRARRLPGGLRMLGDVNVEESRQAEAVRAPNSGDVLVLELSNCLDSVR